jgi:HSP20 family protein
MEKTVAVFLFSPKQGKSDWIPAVDIYRAPWGWVLKFDLAGVRSEDVHVHLGRNTVTVRGVRRDYMIEEGCCHYSMEIDYSRFGRSIELPDDLARTKMSVDYRDGILLVRIRKEGNGE